MTAPAWLKPLTDREQLLLRLIAEGCQRARIARSMNRSVGTVKTEKARLYAKLGARNDAHAVHLAHRYGLLGADALTIGGAR